jgi:hypothetical protein
MFEFENLAAACKLCNGAKGQKLVLSEKWLNEHPQTLPKNTDDYIFVHPHIDEWADHLAFDSIGRIVPSNDSEKGRKTIKVCGISRINAARLADAFGPGGQAEAEKALRNFSALNAKKRIATLSLLDSIAARTGSEKAKIVVACLRADVSN